MPAQLQLSTTSLRPPILPGTNRKYLPPSEVVKTARPESIAHALVQLAERGAWAKLDGFLSQLDQLSETRGAVLMRALNVVPPSRAHKLLPYLIYHGAPADLIQRAILLGALPSGDVSLREFRSALPITVTNLHFAVLKDRFDVANLLLREGHRSTALNAKGETAPEHYARIAPCFDLRSDATAPKIGSLVRKSLAEGIPPEHISRLINTLCRRRAWAAAETVIEECTLGPARTPETRIPRFSISKIAWTSAVRRAPPSLFAALKELNRSEHVAGELIAPPEASSTFLLDRFPPLRTDKLVGSATWNALERRLTILETAAEFTHSDFIAGILNASYTPFLPERLNDELIVLGIEEPPKLSGIWSLTHALVGNVAPLPLMERVLRLRPDLGLHALIQDNGEIICDGTPLHLACSLRLEGHIELLLRSGAPVEEINTSGEIPLHTFLGACQAALGLNQISIVAAFLRAGSPLENRTVEGLELERQPIMGIPLKRFMALVEEYSARLVDGTIQPGPPPVIQRFLIEENGKLVEVDEIRVRSIVLGRIEGSSIKRSPVLKLGEMPLNDLLRIDAFRSAIETLHRSLALSGGLSPSPEDLLPFEKPGPVSSAEKEQEVTDDDPKWLEFPDFDLSGSDESPFDSPSSTEYFGSDESDLEETVEDFEEITDEASAIATSPESESPSANKPAMTFDEIVVEALEGDERAHDHIELAESDQEIDGELSVLADDDDAAGSKAAAIKSTGSTLESFVEEVAYTANADRQSYIDAAAQFLREGSPHETYLMLEAIKEVTASSPTLLNATTRALRTLLFRAPPGTAQFLGALLDRSGYHRPSGFHPYMAEYMCLLNHPFDERKDPGTIGGLSLGISSVARLARFGSMRGDLLYEYGRIGALNFSFPFWRFDAQPITLSADPTTLFERAGMGRRHHSATEQWENPITKKSEHLWGPIFTVAPGDDFHRSFDQREAKRLGYAPLSISTSVVFRRAGVFVGTHDGVLLWRNSSLLFGRDRFEHPGLVCTEPLGVKEIVELTPDDIVKRFQSITGVGFFAGQLQRSSSRKLTNHFLGAGNSVALAARQLKHFNDQFQTVRVQYGRMKFDTHLETAWSSDGKRLRGGYRSPLFPAVVKQLEDRFNRRTPGGKPAIEYLAVSNPDYPPYAPHASIQINERSLECLRLLADGEDAKVSNRAAMETGIENFLNVAFTRGRNSELVLMPGRE